MSTYPLCRLYRGFHDVKQREVLQITVVFSGWDIILLQCPPIVHAENCLILHVVKEKQAKIVIYLEWDTPSPRGYTIHVHLAILFQKLLYTAKLYPHHLGKRSEN